MALIGDGQVSQGSMVVKPNAKKVRRIGDDVLVGFAGSTADAFYPSGATGGAVGGAPWTAYACMRRSRQGLAH